MPGFHVNGREATLLVMFIVVTLINGIVQGGATEALSGVYLVQFSNNQRIGFWATCAEARGGCVHVFNEAGASPSGQLHTVLFVRYFYLVASIFMAIILVTAIGYAFSNSERLLGNPRFIRIFYPLAVTSSMLIGGTALTISTLRRALADSRFENQTLLNTGINAAEAMIWVSFAGTFISLFLTMNLMSRV